MEFEKIEGRKFEHSCKTWEEAVDTAYEVITDDLFIDHNNYGENVDPQLKVLKDLVDLIKKIAPKPNCPSCYMPSGECACGASDDYLGQG